MKLTADVAAEMKGYCIQALEHVGGLTVRELSGNPSREKGQYFALQLPKVKGEKDESDVADEEKATAAVDSQPLFSDELLSTADMLGLVRGAFEREDFLNREQLETHKWLFYAVVVEQEGSDEPIGFVRQYNPQRGFSAGRLLLAYQNALSRFTDPLFNFDLDFDLILAPDEAAILSLTAFDRVFSDIQVVLAQVPAATAAMESALGVGFGETSTAYLVSTCETKPALARRLRRVARVNYLGAVTHETMKAALIKHAFPATRFGTGPNIDLKAPEDIEVLLDMLEQLYYEGDFNNAPLRADRHSTRTQK